MGDVRKLHIMYNFIFKIEKSGQPPYLKALLNGPMHHHNTRNVHNHFLIPQHRTNYMHRSFSVVGVQMWNSLPNNVKNLTHYKFSKYFKDYLLENQV